jgi:thiamine-phosphate pyrophosphorylase
MTRNLERLIDANGNRAAEGLRVLEDLARFLLDDGQLSGRAKELRHRVRQLIPAHVVAFRDTPTDIGTTITAPGEMERARLVDLIRANAGRACEALRAAEEAGKLAGLAECAASLEQVRYGVYTLESGLLSRLPAWLLFRIRLYALVDTTLTSDPVGVASAVARGGAGAVQLRAKGLTQRAYRELAARVQAVVQAHGSLFIVNDHAAVARALGADGLHIGQEDLDIADARTVVGHVCAIGISAHTEVQARRALEQGADYLGLGPVFATTTKPHEPERGVQLLDQVRPLLTGVLRRPSYCIGGLNLERVAQLRERIPHGIAVAGALCRSAEPERTAAAFVSLLVPDDLA